MSVTSLSAAVPPNTGTLSSTASFMPSKTASEKPSAEKQSTKLWHPPPRPWRRRRVGHNLLRESLVVSVIRVVAKVQNLGCVPPGSRRGRR